VSDLLNVGRYHNFEKCFNDRKCYGSVMLVENIKYLQLIPTYYASV